MLGLKERRDGRDDNRRRSGGVNDQVWLSSDLKRRHDESCEY